MYLPGTEGHTSPNASAKCYWFSQVAEHYRTKYVYTYTADDIGNTTLRLMHEGKDTSEGQEIARHYAKNIQNERLSFVGKTV